MPETVSAGSAAPRDNLQHIGHVGRDNRGSRGVWTCLTHRLRRRRRHIGDHRLQSRDTDTHLTHRSHTASHHDRPPDEDVAPNDDSGGSLVGADGNLPSAGGTYGDGLVAGNDAGAHPGFSGANPRTIHSTN